MSIKDYIGENTEYDKKQTVEKKKIRNWLRNVSAFANSSGGTLIFGIKDNEEIIGVKNVNEDCEFIVSKIKERIDPIPQINMRIETIEDKQIILVDVSQGQDTPYYYHGDGTLEAFVRIDNKTVAAKVPDLNKLFLHGKDVSFDSLSTKFKFEDYSFSELKEQYKHWTGENFEEKMFYSLGIVDKSGFLTIAGALIADDSPIFQNRLICTKWNGITKAEGIIDASDSIEFKGSIISLLHNGESFIKKNTKTASEETSFSKDEMPEYAFTSISEALVNALIHRDYIIIDDVIYLDIFDDRIEINSPGGMVSGKKINNLNLNVNSVSSEIRNPILSEIFHCIGLMEKQGNGLRKIIKGYEQEKNYERHKKPSFNSDRIHFRVIFPNLNFVRNDDWHVKSNTAVIDGNFNKPIELTEKEIKFLTFIKTNPRATQEQLVRLLPYGLQSVQKVSKSLQKKGAMMRIGGTRGYWEILIKF